MALELANAASRHREWANEWRWTAYWSSNAATLVLPILAGVAAMESVQYRRRGAEELLGTGRSLARVQGARVAALALWGLLAHGIGVLACTAQAARLHQGVHLPLLPLVPAVVAVVASVTVGAAVGWWWPSLAAAPVLTVGWLALWVLGASTLPALELVNVGTAANSLLGLTTRPAYVLAQVLWWGSLIVLGLGVLTARRRAGWVGAGLALGLVVTGGLVLTGQHERRFEADPHPQRWACRGSAPVVCVDPQYGQALAAVTAVSVPLVRTLGRLGPVQAITRVEQNARLTSGTRTAAGTVAISVPAGHPVNPLEVAWDLVKGNPDCIGAGEDEIKALEDRQRLALWLVRTAFPRRSPPGDPTKNITLEQARSLVAALPTGC